jgi:hypothetical protein
MGRLDRPDTRGARRLAHRGLTSRSIQPTQVTTPQEVEASLVDTHSPATAPQQTTDSSLLTLVQGLPQLTPPWVEQPAVAESTAGMPTPNDATPTPREAARRFARFTEKVQQRRMSPLIASPPRQKAATTRQTLPIRSGRIASQPLAHIPTSKRGEILVMQKMGIAPSLQFHPHLSKHTTPYSQVT